MSKLNLALALGAGLIGGVSSHFLFLLTPVLAQVPIPIPPAPAPAPNALRSQTFELVDPAGRVAGRFSVDPSGSPRITLFDHGKTVSLYPEGVYMKPLSDARPAPFPK